MDSTDRERLSISMEELHKMLGHEELSKAAILVFANKQVTFNIPDNALLSFILSIYTVFHQNRIIRMGYISLVL